MKLFVRWMYFKDLIPHFAKHYANFNIYAVVNNYDCEPGMLETLKEYNFNILNVTDDYETVKDNVKKLKYYIKKIIKPKEWFVVADPDEFHEFPIPIHQIIEYCEKNKIRCHKGKFVDRLAKDGSIPKIKPHVPIEEQFPIQCDTAKLHLGHVRGRNQIKVVLIKGPYFNSPHKHKNSCLHFPVKVHHYKWNNNSVSRLKHRAEMYKKHNILCWEYSQAIIDYLEKHQNKFPIKGLV